MRFLCAFLVCVLVASTALAATVRREQGTVSINRGHGQEPVSGETTGNPGDMVIASPDGRGTIIYADGCEVKVKPYEIAFVLAKSPCHQHQPLLRSDTKSYLLGTALVGGLVGAIFLLKGHGVKPISP
jgi:hypothetical protein